MTLSSEFLRVLRHVFGIWHPFMGPHIRGCTEAVHNLSVLSYQGKPVGYTSKGARSKASTGPLTQDIEAHKMAHLGPSIIQLGLSHPSGRPIFYSEGCVCT